MSHDLLLALAAFCGLACLAMWRAGEAADDPWSPATRRLRAARSIARGAAAVALVVVIVAAIIGPRARSSWALEANRALGGALEGFSTLPVDAAMRLIGMALVANGGAILLAAFAMAAARLVIRLRTPYAPARRPPADRVILGLCLVLANAGLAAAGVAASAGAPGG